MEMPILILSLVLTAVVVGALAMAAGWKLAVNRHRLAQAQWQEQQAAEHARLEARLVNQEVALRQAEEARQQAMREAALAQQARESAQAMIEELRGELQRVLADRDEQRNRVYRLESERERLQAESTQALRHAEEKLQLLAESREQMKKEFEHLAQQVFEARQQALVQQQQQLLVHGRESLDSLLKPFRDQISQFRQRVDEIHTSEVRERAALRAQIEQLQLLNREITEEARHLSEALRGNKKTQGNWGELILETVLERSGLRKGEEYEREVSISTEDGRFRPDALIHLPEGKHLVIDAKVSLVDYTRYVNAEDEVEREKAARAHVEAVRRHINQLSQRAYESLPGLNTPELVFMFMPVEPAFSLAFERDETLFMEAFEKRVAIVTPTTLLASLRTVSSLWMLERQNRNAREIAAQAAKLHDKFAVFVEHMNKVGNDIERAQKSYEDAMKTLVTGRGNLVGQISRLRQLGAPAKKTLPESLMSAAQAADGEDINEGADE